MGMSSIHEEKEKMNHEPDCLMKLMVMGRKAQIIE